MPGGGIIGVGGGNTVYLDFVTRADESGTKKIIKGNENLSRSFNRTRSNLLFLGLGTLFFGMQLRRTFGGILSSGMDTFRKITESTMGAQTAMTGLAAAGEFLQFTIGDALNTVLEPLMPTILELVDSIANFIQEHPEVVFIAITGALAGLALMTFGTVVAFISSISGVFAGVAGTQLSANVAAVGSKLESIGKIAAGGFGVKLIYEGFTDATASITEKIGKTLEGAGLISLAAGKGGKQAAMLFGIGVAFQAVDEIIKNIGDADKLLGTAFKTVGQALFWYGMATGNPYAFAIGFTLQFIEPLTDPITKFFNKFAGGVPVGPFVFTPPSAPGTVPYGGGGGGTTPMLGGGAIGQGGSTSITIDARGALFDQTGIDKLARAVGEAISRTMQGRAIGPLYS